MENDLLEALEASDVSGASGEFGKRMDQGEDAWRIHLSLFPVVQRVLNPPFINPHLPKMYRICREFLTYLKKDEIAALVRLEVNEYARRPKLEKLPKIDLLPSSISFKEIESAIREQNVDKTAVSMATFRAKGGEKEFARKLLLLGSGYLDDSLGHSVSCTAFILLEMIERTEQNPWPALTALAHYFCNGGFHTTLPLRKPKTFSSEEAIKHHLLRAASGRGILNLHHTITCYAIERVGQFLSPEEYDHMVEMWIAFMGDKKVAEIELERSQTAPQADYNQFYKIFSKRDAKSLLSSVEGAVTSVQGRQQLGRFLVKGLCDQYQGDYNPHYLTGLGSALWVLNRCWNQPPVIINALYQYLDFFFSGLKSMG
jgi:hypothetical protein